MGILSKSTIEKWIVPNLTIGERGFEPTVPIVEIVECILHRLKTGCQWREYCFLSFQSMVKKWLLVKDLDKYFDRKQSSFRLVEC
jgi:hypothetical protein